MCRVRLEGVTLPIPEPLGSVDVRFQPGVDVLYGLNGAGKTRILSSLLVALGVPAGDRGGAVQASITDSEVAASEIPWWHRDLLERAEMLAMRAGSPSHAPWLESSVERLISALGAVLYSRLTAGGEYLGGGVDEPLAADITWEVVRQGRVVLQSFGHQQWILWLGVRIGETTGPAADPLRAVGMTIAGEHRPGRREERTFSIYGENTQLAGLLDNAYDYTGVFLRSALVDHPWAALPLFWLDDLSIDARTESGSRTLLPLYHEPVGPLFDLNRLTSGKLRSWAGLQRSFVGPQLEALTSAKAVHRRGDEFLRGVADRANGILRTLLIDAPVLTLDVLPVDDWYDGTAPLRWAALDPSEEMVGVDEMSSAQRRWAQLAITMALSQVPAASDAGPAELRLGEIEIGDRLLVLDEPENALHPSAQRFLAQGLALLDPQLQVVVASHSASFLDETQFRLHHVHRGRGGLTTIDDLQPELRESVCAGLGISPESCNREGLSETPSVVGSSMPVPWGRSRAASSVDAEMADLPPRSTSSLSHSGTQS